jgi:hypothetical protein
MTQLIVMCVPRVVMMSSSTYISISLLWPSPPPTSSVSSGFLPPVRAVPIPPIKVAPTNLVLPALLVALLALNGTACDLGVGRARLPWPSPSSMSVTPASKASEGGWQQWV